MQEKLQKGEATCVRTIGEELLDKTFLLRSFEEGIDYCDSLKENWIWSIGQCVGGNIYAATDGRFYQNPDFECLWLR